MFYIYFLKSQKNKKIYTGFTTKNPHDRLNEHNHSSNKWTEQNGPFELLYYESYCCEKDARQRELFYKTGFGRKVRDCVLTAVNNKGR